MLTNNIIFLYNNTLVRLSKIQNEDEKNDPAFYYITKKFKNVMGVSSPITSKNKMDFFDFAINSKRNSGISDIIVEEKYPKDKQIKDKVDEIDMLRVRNEIERHICNKSFSLLFYFFIFNSD